MSRGGHCVVTLSGGAFLIRLGPAFSHQPLWDGEQRVQHAEHGLQRDAVWNTDLWWQPFLLVFQPWNAQLLQMDIVSVFGLAVGWWHQPGTAVMIMSAGHHQAQHNPRVAQASPCHC